MSRTRRRTLPGWGPGERHYLDAINHHAAGIHPCGRNHYPLLYDFRKSHWYHGRDAYGAKLTLGTPFNKSPKGYNTWDEVWGLRGKRSAKRDAARIIRNRGREECRRARDDLPGE